MESLDQRRLTRRVRGNKPLGALPPTSPLYQRWLCGIAASIHACISVAHHQHPKQLPSSFRRRRGAGEQSGAKPGGAAGRRGGSSTRGARTADWPLAAGMAGLRQIASAGRGSRLFPPDRPRRVSGSRHGGRPGARPPPCSARTRWGWGEVPVFPASHHVSPLNGCLCVCLRGRGRLASVPDVGCGTSEDKEAS